MWLGDNFWINSCLTFASFSIFSVARLARTKVRASIVLAVGIDVTDGGRNTALVDIFQRNVKYPSDAKD